MRLFPRLVCCSAVVAAACSDTQNTTAPAPDTQYWALRLNHHAVTLAVAAPPYDTITLAATPLTYAGTALSTTTAPTYVISDTTVLTINSAGLVTTKQAGQVTVLATLKIGRLTLADTGTIVVNAVTPPLPVFTTFSLLGTFPEIAVFGTFITPSTLDADGNPIPNAAVYFRSSDSTAASIDQYGNVTPNKPGPVTFYAEATIYGVSKVDSLSWTVPQPFITYDIILPRTPVNSTTPVSYFTPGTVDIQAGGFVIWLNQSGQNADIVFDDSSAVGSVDPNTWEWIFQGLYNIGTPANPDTSGNVVAFAAEDSTSFTDGVGVRIRYFANSGTYPFHSALYGTAGVVVVSDSGITSVSSSARPRKPPAARVASRRHR